MKRLLLTAALVCLAAGFGFSDGGIVLKGAYGEFSFLGIQAGRVYIFTGENFHVFNLKDGKSIRTFGNIGQGPGEYNRYFSIPHYRPDGIVLMEMQKSHFFSLDGTFVKTIRPGFGFNKILPIGPCYARLSSVSVIGGSDQDVRVELVTEHLKMVREIYRKNVTNRESGRVGGARINSTAASIELVVDSGKIYVGDPNNDISISIFNGQGNLIRTIKRDVESLEKTSAVKETIPIEGTEKTVEFKFPPTQSAFRFIQVEQGLIYVFANQKKDGKSELIVLDEEGRDVGTAWITHASRMNSCIYQKKYYYVAYDETIDELVLHAEDIFR